MHMNNLSKDAVIGFIVLAVVVAGIVWYAVVHPSPAIAPGTGEPSAGSGAAAHMTENSQYYAVDMQYPGQTALAGLPDSADVNAVALMKQWEIDTIADFKNSFTNLEPSFEAHLKEENLKGSLTDAYEVHAGTNTVTYFYTVYEDTLGAHPNGFYKTFTFDTRDGRNLAIGDLFAPGTNYLSFLSTYSRAKLLPMIAAREEVDPGDVDTSMLDDGTTADAANFQDFYLDEHTLVLLFEPYAVGPYVLGALELDIPTSAVTGLKADYQ